MSIEWNVQFTNQLAKQAQKLNKKVLLVLQVLIEDLRTKGPAPGKHWHNYGKLHSRKQEDKRHCHLIKGNPTYVCCWEIYKSNNSIEVFYVGTHEKAPY